MLHEYSQNHSYHIYTHTHRYVVLNQGWFSPIPQVKFSNVWLHFQFSQLGGRMQLTSTGWKPGMLLDILQYTGQSPTASIVGPKGPSVEAEQP